MTFTGHLEVALKLTSTRNQESLSSNHIIFQFCFIIHAREMRKTTAAMSSLSVSVKPAARRSRRLNIQQRQPAKNIFIGILP